MWIEADGSTWTSCADALQRRHRAGLGDVRQQRDRRHASHPAYRGDRARARRAAARRLRCRGSARCPSISTRWARISYRSRRTSSTARKVWVRWWSARERDGRRVPRWRPGARPSSRHRERGRHRRNGGRVRVRAEPSRALSHRRAASARPPRVRVAETIPDLVRQWPGSERIPNTSNIGFPGSTRTPSWCVLDEVGHLRLGGFGVPFGRGRAVPRAGRDGPQHREAAGCIRFSLQCADHGRGHRLLYRTDPPHRPRAPPQFHFRLICVSHIPV